MINPTTSSPVLKKPITITGTGFGTDKTKVKVYLKNKDSTKDSYELGVESVTDTSITAILGGGHVGNFVVSVYI